MDHFVLYPLKPEAEYEFRMMGKKEGMETRWSETVSTRTGARTVIPEVDNAVRLLRIDIDSTESCSMLLMHINELAGRGDDHVKAFGEAGAIELIVKAMNTHTNNAGVCEKGCGTFMEIIMNDDNIAIVGQAGAIEAIVKAMNTHADNADICKNGCGALLNITLNAENKIRAAKADAIDVVLNSISSHSDNVDICESGRITLWNTSGGDSSIQERACEKGGLPILLDILEVYGDDQYLAGSYCGAIGMILSSQKTHSKYCTPAVLDAVRRCSEKHKDNEEIKQFLLGLTREEDPRVRDAVSRGVCTKEAFPKCSEECECDENIYCPKCCVQQKAFRCLTCDRDEIRLYCETCIKRDHQGHECEEFFYPVRCGTK